MDFILFFSWLIVFFPYKNLRIWGLIVIFPYKNLGIWGGGSGLCHSQGCSSHLDKRFLFFAWKATCSVVGLANTKKSCRSFSGLIRWMPLSCHDLFFCRCPNSWNKSLSTLDLNTQAEQMQIWNQIWVFSITFVLLSPWSRSIPQTQLKGQRHNMLIQLEKFLTEKQTTCNKRWCVSCIFHRPRPVKR